MSKSLSTLALMLLCLFIGFTLLAQPKQLTEAERNYILVETLERITGDIDKNPALKDAVYNTLRKLRGREAFVGIVKKFGIKDQDKELLDLALRHGERDFGVEAAQLVFEHGNGQLFATALSRTNEAPKAVEILGRVNDKRVVPLLLPVLMNERADVSLRKAVVHSLTQTHEGATQLLQFAKEEKLPAALRFTAGSELSSVRWLPIKSEAEKVLPLPQGKNTEPFPSVATLAQMKGSKANGETVFFRDAAMCSRCHEVRGKGGQIGPALSEIGTKLGRQALIEAILDPSAGISFGFEGFNIALKSGDEAYGLIASETEDDIAIKDLNGIVTRYKKSDIAKRDPLKSSIMPTGLQQTMSPQEFVDLIEYLSSLKKVEEAKR
jgi:putative heme-binding domain-containing protein